MRVLICAVQVPFQRGGAELLVEGLRDALREAGHEVDVAALPFNWVPRENLLAHALAWRLLDLTHVNRRPIDRVIATKFPSYLVRHPHKVVWLVHQHRQAYDWYGTDYSDFAPTPQDRRWRSLIRRMDARGLGEARRLFAISRNVAARLARFNGLRAEPLYPPSRYQGRLRPGPYGDYLLYVGRLDRAKRLDLLLRALAEPAAREVRLKVAGRGEAGPELQRLARRLGVADRVRFLGFVDDETLLELYAGARAVYYAPVDEDYGFATVEALEAARPVLTTTDSGGVLEFVADGDGGLVVPPEPAALAEAAARLWADPALCARLGSVGPEKVRGITWERVLKRLLG